MKKVLSIHHRDFFAFGKEVSSGIWLRPKAALGSIGGVFGFREDPVMTNPTASGTERSKKHVGS